MTKSLHDKLVLIQTKLHVPKKHQHPMFKNHKYRKADDILENVKPYLAEHNLRIITNETVLVTSPDSIRFKYVEGINQYNKTVQEQFIDSEPVSLLKCVVTISDGVEQISAESTVGVTNFKKGNEIAQSYGASISYAKKYALCSLLGIDDGDDHDSLVEENKAEPQYTKSDSQLKSEVAQVFAAKPSTSYTL